jgi:APA family basic amino acid/polyamine antiporter
MSPKTVFAREATGLVKRITLFDFILMGIAIVNLGLSLEVVFAYYYTYPGMSLPWTLLTTMVAVCPPFILVYSIFGTAMPRSGGDYIWIARTFNRHPWVSTLFVSLAGLTTSDGALWIAGGLAWYAVYFVVSPIVASYGIAYGSETLLNLASWLSQPIGSFLVAVVILSAVFLLLCLGLRFFTYLLRIFMIYSWLCAIVWVYLALTTTTGSFAASFNAYMASRGVAMTYQGVIDTASKEFGAVSVTVNPWITFWAAFSAGWSIVVGFQWTTYLGGEVKHASRTIPIGLTLAVASFTLPLVGMLVLFSGTFGYDFLGAINALFAAGSASYPFTAQPGFNLLFALVNKDPVVLFLVNSGVFASTFIWVMVAFLQPSRLIFGLSFDRLLPTWMADVNERFRSPIKALFLIFILTTILAYIVSQLGFYAAVYGGGAIYVISYMMISVAAMAYPYVKREQYNRIVLPTFRKKIAGIPLITVSGIWLLIVSVIMLVMFVSPSFAMPELSSIFDVFGIGSVFLAILGLAWWFGVYYYRKSQGIDLSLVFQEVPPE